MTARPLLIAAIFAVSALASSAAPAQDEAEDETQHRFMRMHEMTQEFEATDDPMQRRMLMHDHMMLMREQMTEADGMMMGGGHMDHGDEADMTMMHEHMSMMHQMMMQMMAQQHMMMELQEADETDDEDE